MTVSTTLDARSYFCAIWVQNELRSQRLMLPVRIGLVAVVLLVTFLLLPFRDGTAWAIRIVLIAVALVASFSGQLFNGGGVGVLVEFPEFQRFDAPFPSGTGQETPRRADFLHDIAVDFPDLFEDRGGQDVGGRVVAERGGNQIEFTAVHRR